MFNTQQTIYWNLIQWPFTIGQLSYNKLLVVFWANITCAIEEILITYAKQKRRKYFHGLVVVCKVEKQRGQTENCCLFMNIDKLCFIVKYNCVVWFPNPHYLDSGMKCATKPIRVSGLEFLKSGRKDHCSVFRGWQEAQT